VHDLNDFVWRCADKSDDTTRFREAHIMKSRVSSHQIATRTVRRPSSKARTVRSRTSKFDPSLPARAEKLLRREIAFIHNRAFSRTDVEKAVAEFEAMSPTGAGRTRQPPADVPAYFRELYATPLLTADEEKALFRLMNLFKYRANVLRADICPDSPSVSVVQEVERLLALAGRVRERIVRANLRLVVSIARRFANDLCTFDDLVSDGNVALLNAVEKFDYGRGFRFSTYATHAVQRDFFRIIRKRRNESSRCTLGISEMLANSPDDADPVSVETDKIRQVTQVRELMTQQLSEREQLVVALRFGLQPGSEPATLQVVADALQVSKERVRQIELKAIEKMQRGATGTRWQTAG
jgi:RNA polymerase primary sigma factor